MSEPDAGSALTDLTTKGVIEENFVILNGTKMVLWSRYAEAYVVYCRMSDEKGAKGIGAVVVEKGATGFSFGKKKITWDLEVLQVLTCTLTMSKYQLTT